MKSLKTLIILILFPALISAQQGVNYNDVAVIINDNSQTSIDIGTYFQQQRNIPSQNIIYISATNNEIVDSLEFEQIRHQIETYLTLNDLGDSINYIVTTKGVPLKVKQDTCDVSSFANCASFDSELSLILSSLSSNIANSGRVNNPYLYGSDHFSRSKYGIYLVTRLDGYSKNDVINLIDRSGPHIHVNKTITNSIFDISYVTNPSELSAFTRMTQSTISLLELGGWATTFHPDTTLLTNQQNVFGYFSINYQPSNKVLNNTWVKGSIAEILYPFSAGTFDETNNPDKELLIADLISEGATGANGYAYYMYATGSLLTEILFDRYTDTAFNFNLAESYYMAIPGLSWQNIIIGDPKTSISIDNTSSIDNIDYTPSIRIYPNPSKGKLTIETGNISLHTIEVYNQMGQSLYFEDDKNHNEITIDLTNQPNGIYFLNIESDIGLFKEKVIIMK